MDKFPAGTKAYSYVRFSTPDQALGDSLRRQLKAATDYAAEHGLRLDTTMRDLGVSAYGGANRLTGALGRFLAAVESGQVRQGSVLIVESLDRLSRQDVLSAQEQLLGLIRSGIVVVTLTDLQVYSRASIENDWTRLMLSIVYMARAHEESATKARRVAEAWDAKRQRAAETGDAQTSRCVAWCRLEGNPKGGARHVLIPERVELLTRIFEMTASGYGQRSVAKKLNQERVPVWGRGKKGWQPSYITKLLEGRAVLGFFQPHVKPKRDVRRTPQGAELADYYPQAISEDLYYRALSARVSRKGKGGRKPAQVPNLFTGLSHCASCGGTMVRLNKGDTTKGGQYLTCDSAMRGMPCEEPARWRYQVAEAAILRGIRGLDVAAVLKNLDPAAVVQARHRALVAQLEAAERQRDRLLDALGDVDDPAVIARVRSAAETVSRLKVECAVAEKAAGMVAHGGGGLGDRVAMVGQLAAKMAGLEGQDLADLRTTLSQELRRTLVRLEFTPANILADYRIEGERSALAWTRAVPLIQSEASREHWAEQHEIDASTDGQPRFGERRAIDRRLSGNAGRNTT